MTARSEPTGNGRAPLAGLARLAFYLGILLVIALSLIPQDAMPDPETWDKANHVAAYGAIAVAGGLGYRSRRALLRIALGLLLLGAGLELAQSVLPGRVASVADLLANAIGIALGLLLAVAAHALRSRIGPGAR